MAGGDRLYEELWRACAGSLVNVPKAGERVFYFFQGHIEHSQTLTGLVLDDQVPISNVPSKVLCRVIDSQLKAEADTNEVYVQVTLLPESNQSDPLIPDPCIPEPSRPTVRSFCKILTALDTNGRCLVLHNHATESLPPLDMLQDIPSQELVVRDFHGHEWKFKHVYGGEPKRHLLTAGWNKFVRSKRLIPGDSFIFLRSEGEELCVGIRRSQMQRPGHTSHAVSSKSMQLQTLINASQAVTTRNFFTVYHVPRVNEFIVSVNKYLQAVKSEYTTGMEFRMNFGDGNSFIGTIAGIGDSSKWKSLKVQWDEITTINRPLRVCPWDIEFLRPSRSPTQPAMDFSKLAEPNNAALQYPRSSTLQSTHREKEILDSQPGNEGSSSA